MSFHIKHIISGSNDVFRLSDEEFWEAHGGMGRISPGTLSGIRPEISPNSTQIDLLTANEETQVSAVKKDVTS